MPKIKRKVEMTLPQLIEWGFKNNIKNREFSRNHKYFKPVVFNSCGYVDFRDDYAYSPEDTFTVEVEEEIDEDTVLPMFIEIFTGVGNEIFIDYHENENIKEVLEINSSRAKTKTINLINNDGTMTLIWKEGKLIE